MPLTINVTGNIVTDADKAGAARSLENALRPFINGTNIRFSWQFVPRKPGVNPVLVTVPRTGVSNSREEELLMAVQNAICHYGRVSVILS